MLNLERRKNPVKENDPITDLFLYNHKLAKLKHLVKPEYNDKEKVASFSQLLSCINFALTTTLKDLL